MRHSLALGARTHAGASQRRRTLKIDVDGRVDGAMQIPSPNCDERPPETEVSLIVVHGISLPPGRFGGDAIPRAVHEPSRIGRATRTSQRSPACASRPHFLIRREGALLQFVPCAARAWHAGASAWRGRPSCNDFSIGIELEGADDRPYTGAQYRMLVAACAGARRALSEFARSRGTATSPPDARPTRARASTGDACRTLPDRDASAWPPAAIRGIIVGLCAFSRTTFRFCSFSSRSSGRASGLPPAVAIAASIVQIAWFHWRGSVSAVHWLSLAIIVVFGGATLILRDETFIKWKPTVLYLSFALILAAGKLVWRRDLLALVMKDIELPPAIWTKLTWSWVAFFVAMASPNWYVAFHYSTETWVELQGLGRHRAVPAVRARPGRVPRPPRDRAVVDEPRRNAAKAGWRRWHPSRSKSATTAPSTPATPAQPAAPGTFP